MAEVLSSTASVIAVAACAGSLTKFLFKVFRENALIPEHVHDLFTALQSLQMTLLGLQRCVEDLNPNLQFSPYFRQRLADCLNHLRTFNEKIAKIDGDLYKDSSNSHKPGRRTRRSWQKIKWLTTAEPQTKRFLETVRLYQAEFSLELLTLLVKIHASLPRQQAVNFISQPSGQGPMSLHLSSQPQIKSSGRDATSLTWAIRLNDSGSFGSQPQIRVCFILRFDSMFSDCMIRVGPVITKLCNAGETSHAQIKYCNIGFGMKFSLCFPKLCCKRLDLDLMIVWNPVFYRTRLATFWDLDCARIVPQQSNIFQYVRTGSIDDVKRMMQNGQASMRDITKHGITLLHAASGTGRLCLVKFLIEQGADVNAADEDGETPLHRATSLKNNYAVARLLIESGADLANVAIGNRTPLHAVFNDTMGRVLTSGDMVEDVGPDSDGMSIAHFLAWSSQTTPEVFERGRARDAVDLWSADSSGRTCLHYGASRGNLNLLKYLLDRAPPSVIHRLDDDGQSVIHYAVRSSRMNATLELLRAKGLNVSATDARLQNVLHHAAKWRELDAIEKLMGLLQHERDLLSPDKKGQMPSEIAYRVNSSAVYLYLQRLESTDMRTRDTTQAQISKDSKRSISPNISHNTRRISLRAPTVLQNARSLQLLKMFSAALILVCLVHMALLVLQWRAMQQRA